MSAAQDAASFGGVGRLAPGSFANQTHGAVAETVDGNLTADEKCAAGRGRWDVRFHDEIRCYLCGQLGDNAWEPEDGRARILR